MPSSAPDAPADAPRKAPHASVSPEKVRQIADLARLEFSEDEAEEMAQELGRLLGYAQQLEEVDVTGVEPMPAGAPAPAHRLRSDDAQKPLSQKEALENAPDADEDGFFRVPGVLNDA